MSSDVLSRYIAKPGPKKSGFLLHRFPKWAIFYPSLGFSDCRFRAVKDIQNLALYHQKKVIS